MNFTLADLLDRLATRAFDEIAQGIGRSFCPVDGALLVTASADMRFCPTCQTKWPIRERAQEREQPMGDTRPFTFRFSVNQEAFRPPFAPRRRGDGFEPPRAKGRPKRVPPPRAARPALSPMDDAYRLLGLKPGCSASDVKARRRELAMRHHPDHGGDGSKLARVNAAADLLLEIL